MKLKSRRFGELNIPDEKVITFPDGLLGFPELKKFALLEHSDDTPLHWLVSIDEPELAFVVIEPTTFLGEYKVELTKLDVEKLELEEDTETAVLTIVVIPEDPREMTANIKGPLVINVEKMLGRQVVMDNDEYSVKHKIFQHVKDRNPKESTEEKVVVSVAL